MKYTGQAYFVSYPRTVGDLMKPHLISEEHKYRIAQEIILDYIDYENFTADMLVDRCFIGEYAPLCAEGDVYYCLLIRSLRAEHGVLVLPKDAFVKRAALLKLPYIR